MACTQLKAHAPGSLMLLGEYAVLHGHQALVCAVDKRISVTLTPRSDQRIEITSSLLGHYSTNIAEIKIVKPFHFVLGALQQFQTKLKYGCDIHIESEFSDKVGLGSSAAVTVATLAALSMWLDNDLSLPNLLRDGRRVILDIQGVGSGADIAASVYGGIVNYQPQTLEVEKNSIALPLHAIYAGFKTPTVDAIKHVQNRFAAYPELFHTICQSIAQCVKEGAHCLRAADWKKLGEIMSTQQGLLEALGVSSALLHGMVDDLRQQPAIFGAKISGSGLGDCVIGLGDLPEDYSYLNLQRISIAVTSQGVYCEQI